MIEPLVSQLVLGGDGHGTALLRSAAAGTEHAHVAGPRQRHRDGLSRTTARGRPRRRTGSAAARPSPVTVPAGGFTLVRR